MQEYHGKGVSDGIAVGKIFLYRKALRQMKHLHTEDTDAEIKRYKAAVSSAASDLDKLYQKALCEVGKAEAAIFETHRFLLEDVVFTGEIEHLINTQRVSAETAVILAEKKFSEMLEAVSDICMQERAADIHDVSQRLINMLSGTNTESISVSEPVILIAQDLSPSEIIQLDKDKILALVTVKGSENSHAAILSRTKGIPAIVGADIPFEALTDGMTAIVDGIGGNIYINPDREMIESFSLKIIEQQKRNELYKELRGKESVSRDGRRIRLYANIGGLEDLPAVLQNDAEGIGLFRSEFIYLKKSGIPTEEEQFQIYKTVLEAMADRRVIIRTLDLGADKVCEYLGMEEEKNPAMGCRGIRFCLTRPDIFKTQLRALVRASIYGNPAIMYPMITSVEEVRRIKAIVSEVKRELSDEGIKFGNPQQGIMIETPAAVMMSRELAAEVDFFSIGTNDLTQYILAVDRQNERLNALFDTHHPAVIRMIRMTVESAHKEGIWVGLCGELGADLSLTKEFLSMGIDELSVAPHKILSLRKKVLEIETV